MPEKITKAKRWLDLVIFVLRHRYPVTVEQIMEDLLGRRAGLGNDSRARRDSPDPIIADEMTQVWLNRISNCAGNAGARKGSPGLHVP